MVAGVYGEPQTAERPVTIKGNTEAPLPVIINTGTFVDKHGAPPRWHVNKKRTLYWDGIPFLPIGGMHIPDENFDTFKAQIDLLVRNNVRDVYWNVGHSTQMPRTWETKSDDRLRHFQRCIDYMDEAGVRYGMQFSGLQANGYAYPLMGGKEVAFRILPGQHEPRLERSNDQQWYKDGKVHVAYRRIREGYYLITRAETGRIVDSGAVEVARDAQVGRRGERLPAR